MSPKESSGLLSLLDFLVEEGLIGKPDAGRVRQEQENHGGSTFYNLLKLRLATAPKLFAFIEEKLGLLYWHAEDSTIDTTLLDLIPPNIAHFYKIVPVKLEQNVLTLAASAVSSAQLLPALEEITGCKVRVLLTHPAILGRALERYYTPKIEADVFDSTSGEKVFVLKDEEKQIRPVNVHMLNEGSTASDWLRTILAEAVIKRSRQVFFRQGEDAVQVFFVREGEPHVEFTVPIALYQSIAAFVDYLTSVGPFDTQVPQEKRARIKVSDRTISVQVSSVPETGGRSIAFDLYDEKTFEYVYKSIFDAPTGETAYFPSLVQKRRGLIIFSVAPGTHKKLVLYSLLAEAQKATPAVYALEESIFYTLPGIHQVSFGSSSQRVFSRLLETTLRQHPDLLAIDAVRDVSMMELALLSSSRCLVLAVCSSPDLRAVLKWLTDSGLRPALKARLVPAIFQLTSVARLCKYCRKDIMLTEEEIAMYDLPEYRERVFWHNTGCPVCKGASSLMDETLCEITAVDDTLLAHLDHPEQVVALRRRAGRLKASSSGPQNLFPSLLQKGLHLAKDGKADIKDVLAKCAFLG